jgi:serine/threonine protein kinase
MNLSAATWREVSRLLDEALDLDPAARAGWLAALGQRTPSLAPTVARLLAAHAGAETDDVLQRLPALRELEPEAPRTPDTGELAPGARVGPYRLVRELGRGGMADVWLARRADGAFARDVALKLPHASRLRRDLAPRFSRERDILARLEHPNIARLYDAGVDGGLPYLAMEYVDGATLTEYCDARNLDLPARLALFTQVLDAVRYAHANLIIHRDLKPSNILVTVGGDVRLLDFGIAKLLGSEDATQETQLTRVAGRALTPDYASPEQVRGEPLTVASDLYALGVLLYELLCGARPYRLRHASAAQLEHAILEAAVVAPSSALTEAAATMRGGSARRLARALAGDLDTIVLKCLKKRVADRYESVAALAEDLQRHQRGEPVHARPDSARYRLAKFLQRHKLETGIAAALLVALVGGAHAQVAVAAALAIGSGVALWQARVARRQAATARQERAQALAAADAARRAETRAVAMQGFMSDLFRANALEQENPAAMRQLTAQQLLDRGARQLEHGLRDAPEARVALWALFGRLYDDLDLFERALDVRRRAADETRELHGADSLAHGRALVQYVSALRFRRDQRALALRLLADAHRILKHHAALSDANASEYADALLVETLWVRDPEPQRAVALAAEAVRLRRRCGAPPAALADALLYLGWSSNLAGEYTAAQTALEESRSLFAAEQGERAAVMSIVWRGLGESLAGQFRHAQAVDALTTAIDIQLATHSASETHSVDGRFVRAQSLIALGRMAEAYADEAAIAAFQAPPGLDVVTAMNRVRVRMLHVARGEAQAALALREVLPALVVEASAAAVAGWTHIARAQLQAGAIAAARESAATALALLRERGAPVPRSLELTTTRVELLAAEGRADEAWAILAQARAALDASRPPNAIDLELDLGEARAARRARDWPRVEAVLARWQDPRRADGALPVLTQAEICEMLAAARRAKGSASDALEREALALRARLARELADGQPRLATPVSASG